ncbi:GNAT family N-acetyltransferase [Aquipuribacter sp. MA13-6]|uniref:GNAT family N-acetyltransferase n=1 Tax=unclassified Aquipuribacter TaxID=2635084 RepID=UPI003EEF41AC
MSEPVPARRRRGRGGSIRPYRRSDDAGLAEVCLRTAADGDDASGDHAEPALPGAVYAIPYVRFEPDLCLVLDDGTRAGRVAGYVLGTSDTVAFEQWCDRAWWPEARRRYPVEQQAPGSADERLSRLVQQGVSTPRSITDRYPAHLHVDLLPSVQGEGWGRRLLERFFVAAAGAGAGGVHVGVSAGNDRAIAFYARLGFHLVERTDEALVLGRPLP